ncbi:MAG: multidrug MFS transporter [Eubacteriaceae bacterium]|jgi:UDP-N-acetylglucosamine transferase subunit ALG13|uniref:Multidrug MFS transporter n=1 Tax=Candidatus Pseudoramibacter fermentans TaxID=2594427 RepID=A0A6L5GS64_9FIRM|nr:multidrug MFS transporter [Candidatus Pseudoramibacter fermentans]RRF92079.1 MAG: multidrug MFS transporter [Eubacteriaceae bacterium]
MIFVTVGTHEQPFDRLIKYVDHLAKEKVITEEVFIQTGYSTFQPKYCEWSQFIPYSQMVENVQKSRITITHGGPSSFILPLQYGKIPIVVPRQKKYNEHINNHQLEFSEAVKKSYQNIIVIEDIKKLKSVIEDYDNIVKKMPINMMSHNKQFCKDFAEIVDDLFNV